MKFIKFACVFGVVCVFGITGVFAELTRTCSAGYYAYLSTDCHDCPSGCYCPGGTNQHGTGWAQHEVSEYCRTRVVTGHVNNEFVNHGTVILCPEGYTSAKKASSINQCYKSTTCGTLYYAAANCGSTTYMPAKGSSCLSCPEGYYCDGIGLVVASCNNQGITGECSEGNLYSRSGAAECSYCEEVGKAVVEQNGLNVNCQTCDAGKYANATHTNCDPCPVGYECPPRDENRPDDRPGGIAIRCGFDGDNENNQYQDEEGKTSCKTCTGTGKGVVVTTNDDDVRLHTGCTTCPDGTYPYNGICKTCEAGYYCKNGTRTICAKGTYAGTGQSSCTPCARYYTTQSTGSTSRSACIFAGITLKTSSAEEEAGIKFPTCLLQGDINMTVVR